MKRHYSAITTLAFALGVTTCSPGSEETTAAPTTTAAQTETGESAETEDDIELEHFYGFVGEVVDKTITIKDDTDREVKFGVSEAKIGGADTIGRDDEIRVAYASELFSDTTKAKSVDIVTSAAAETVEEVVIGGDAIAMGTIGKADDDTLTLTTNEDTYTFNTKITQRISRDGVKSDVQADVAYYGDLEDDTGKPMTTKIVTESAMDSEDAKINTPSGKVTEVGADYMIIDTVDPENTLFTLPGKEGMSDKLKIGDTTAIIYKGTLTDKIITAIGMK